MTAVALFFPHQLFAQSPLHDAGCPCVLVEEHLYFRELRFHRQKLLVQRASLRHYKDLLEARGCRVRYVDSDDTLADVRRLLPQLAREGIRTLHFHDPCDDWLLRRLMQCAASEGLELQMHATAQLLNTREELQGWFGGKRKRLLQQSFYVAERKKRGILLDDRGEAAGGKWSYDDENRRRYPVRRQAPALPQSQETHYHREALAYVQRCFPDNPGALSGPWTWPVTHDAADQWLERFLELRFADFGTYEDAIVADEHVLHHSLLSPLLNNGLLTPAQVLKRTLQFAATNEVPINSVEGFLRQLVGWREFIRGVYHCHGRVQRTRNFWGHDRSVPESFLNGTTGLVPVDVTIRKVLATGYCHHIERLMVLGSCMLLCEFDPNAVYRWFMALFIDAHDWVMVPNVYGMSQFADGGLMATKPYICGSNYLRKMGDFPPGPWCDIWDGLFWRFLRRHETYFRGNPRLALLLGNLARMPVERREYLLNTADSWLAALDVGKSRKTRSGRL